MGDLFYSVDSGTMISGLLFIIFFVVINFSLSRIFKKERASGVIISLCTSLLAVYGINKTNLNLSGLFFNLGISEELLSSIIPWIILIGIVLASFVKDSATGKRRFRLYRTFLILGGVLIILGLTPIIYQKGVVLIAGIIFFLIGLGLWLKNKIHLKKNVESGRGVDILIEEARNFKHWALRQRNPKFYGTWAYFIGYLHRKRGYPRGETAICNQLGISQRDFVTVFRRYGLVS
jgi:hypothetical protein